MEYVIVMKVGPHSGMSLEDIIKSKIEEEKNHGVHYWGYSGVFCLPNKVQEFCEKKKVKLVLLETKSAYDSDIGFISGYSINSKDVIKFEKPVQLQGAKYSFVAKNINIINDFNIDNYIVCYGKNEGKRLSEHLKFRVNKSFAKKVSNNNGTGKALVCDLVYPYGIYLHE